MNEKSIASRYARALFDIAEERDEIPIFLDQLSQVSDTVYGEEEIRNAFTNRLIPVEEKKELVKSLFTQEISPLLNDFLFLLLDKGREAYLQDILTALQQLVDEKNGVLVVKVKTASKMEEKQKQDLVAAISEITGMKTRLEITVDDRLIGGLIMTIEDTVYDGSISGQLSLLKQHLAGSDRIEH